MSNGITTTQVLVVCGPSGTGKTVTAWEIGRILESRQVPHALIDTDELDRVWPQPEPVEALIAISRRNLEAVWATFSNLGVRRLVLCGVMASIPQSKPWIEDAIPGATVTFVRLTADHDVREQRLRDREAGSGFDHEMQASDRAAAFIQRHDPIEMREMRIVVTDGKGIAAVAEEVLRVADWTA
jgi:hypothetical protein